MSIPTRERVVLFADIEHRARNFALNEIRHPFPWHAEIAGLCSTQEIELELPVRHRLSAPTRQALKAIPGVMVQDL